MLHWGVGRRFVRLGPATAAAALDPDAVTLIAAMSVAPDATRQALISTTITAIKAAGAWTPTDELYFTAAHDVQAGKLNWINPALAPLVAVNSPTFTTDRGFTGDGATSGLATTGTNVTTLAHFAQDSAAIGAWSLTDGTGAGSDFGTNGASNTFFIIRSASNNMTSRLNGATSGSVANAGAIGLFGAVRTNAADYQPYKNGAVLGSAIAQVSAAPTALPFCICRGQTTFSVRQMAAGFCGGALNSTQWAGLHAALLAYLQAVGAA